MEIYIEYRSQIAGHFVVRMLHTETKNEHFSECIAVMMSWTLDMNMFMGCDNFWVIPLIAVDSQSEQERERENVRD